MNIGSNLTNNSHFSPYTSSAFPAAAGAGGEGDVAAVLPRAGVSFPSGGDSLMAMHSGSYSYSGFEQRRVVSIETRRFRWRGVYLVATVISGVSALVFVFLASQPILVFVFTLGGCVSDGCDEWLEFSSEVLRASLIPLAVGMVACIIACTAYLVQRRLMR